MRLLYCPSCGTVYVEGTAVCINCEATHEWCPQPLQPVKSASDQEPGPEAVCLWCKHSYADHIGEGGISGCRRKDCECTCYQ